MTTKERAKRTKRATIAKGEIVPRDLDVLESLAWAGFLSTSQIERLHFGSKRIAQRRLRVLLDHGFVRASLQAGALHRDSIFAIAPEGIERLRDERFSANPEAVRSGRLPRIAKVHHSLLVREVFLALVWAERDRRLQDLDVLFEPATLAPFSTASIIPDLVVHFSSAGRARQVSVEVDNGTETTTALRTKFTKYLGLSVEVWVVADRPGRLLTLERVVEELGLHVHAQVLSLQGLKSHLMSGDFTPYVPPVRSERIVSVGNDAEIVLTTTDSPTAFRVLD